MNFDNYNDSNIPQSMLRSCIDVLRSLYNITKDMPKMLKQVATPVKHVGVDLSDVSDDQRADIMTNIRDVFKQFDSTDASSISLDKRHDLKMLGTGSNNKLINPITFMNPLMTIIIAKFMIASGILIPESSNKATIKRQEMQAEQQLRIYRDELRSVIKNKIFPKVVDTDDKDYDIHFNVQHDFDMEQTDKYIALYNAGLITKEEVQRILCIRPDKFSTQTYIEEPKKTYMKTSDTNFTTSREEKVDSDSVRM